MTTKPKGTWFVSLERTDGRCEHIGHSAYSDHYPTTVATNSLRREDVVTAAVCFRADGRKHHKVLKVFDRFNEDDMWEDQE